MPEEHENFADRFDGHPNDAKVPAEEEQEVVYYQGSPLLRGELGLVIGWFVVGLILIAVPILWIVFSDGYPPWFLWFLPLIGLGLIFFPALWVKRNRYKITNYRIDYEHGLVTTDIDTLELWHVNDISMRQGPIDKLFGVGSIHITADDKSTPELTFRSVADPRRLYEQLKDRVIRVKRQRGVIKMDMGG